MFKLSEKKYIPLSDVEVQHYIDDKFNTKHIHLACFPHLYSNLCNLTDNHIPLHLDLMKHKDLAKDRSHAGSLSHLTVAELLYKTFM